MNHLIRTDKNKASVRIASISIKLPEVFESVQDIFIREKIDYNEGVSGALGIDQVPVYQGKWKTDPAVHAARDCIEKSGIAHADIGVIIDFSVMPEDYVVPSWCISNQIQQELGATNAFNIGFGGNGTTNLLVAFQFASALIQSGEINTALLVASDIGIKDRRVIMGGSRPLSVSGDGASALLLSNNSGIVEILDTELCSDGNLHDICCIRGGGLAFPDRDDLYKLEIAAEKFDLNKAWSNVKRICDRIIQRANLNYSDISELIFPNISKEDTDIGYKMFGISNTAEFDKNRRTYGHIQANDIIINLQQFIQQKHNGKQRIGLVCSHGWGFSYGAMLVRC